MNSERYLKVLEDHVYPLSFRLGDPSSEWIFMDNNVPCYQSNSVRDYKASAGIRSLDWPAKSPDLNPIEHVWAIMKRRIRRQIRPGDDMNQLESLVRREWDQLDQQVIRSLVDSMPSWVRKVIEHEGDESGY